MTKKRINNVILFNFSSFKDKSKAGEICTKLLEYKDDGYLVGIYSKKLDIDDLRRQVNDFFKDINGNRCFAQDDNPFLLVPQTLMKDTFSGQIMFMNEFNYTAPDTFKQGNYSDKKVQELLGIEKSKITIRKKDILPATVPAAAVAEAEGELSAAAAPAAAPAATVGEGEEETSVAVPVPAPTETGTPVPVQTETEAEASAETEPSSPTQPRRLPAREPPSIPQPQQDNITIIEGIKINKSHCRDILPIYVDEKKNYIDIVVNKDPMRGKAKISEWTSMNDARLIGYSKFDGKHHYRVRKIKRVPELIKIICNKFNSSRPRTRKQGKQGKQRRGTRRGTRRRGRGTRG